MDFSELLLKIQKIDRQVLGNFPPHIERVGIVIFDATRHECRESLQTIIYGLPHDAFHVRRGQTLFRQGGIVKIVKDILKECRIAVEENCSVSGIVPWNCWVFD